LGIFLIYGLLALNWNSDLGKYLMTFGVALLTQAFFIAIGRAHISSWKSAMITSLGLCLLFKGNHISTVALAAFIGVASKFLVRYNG
jgi:Na+-transporting NADH:ubiquinone oxidoreductase subunit NqrB